MSQKNYRRAALTGGLLTVMLSLAACGGAGQPATAKVDPDCVPKHEFPTITEGVLSVAAFNSPPKFHALSNSGPFEGVDAELISLFAEENCLTVEFKPMTGPAAQLDLKDGKSDMMGGLILKSEARGEIFGQSKGYITYETVGITSKEGYNSVDDLKGKKVGLISGSTYVAPAKEALGAELVEEYQNDVNAFEDLTAGRVDALVWQTMQGTFHSSTNPEFGTEVIEEDADYPILTGLLENNWPHTKDVPEFTAAIDDFYERVKEDGTAARVLEENGLENSDFYINGR
ncbi:substrate-binding periplasmic protein [Arthrobacter sulfonylureivorans]|uniref:Transporter substrate-binding domain-containing protein n=1 Tax=Arthrobacter sulfonylureivorans TaxID=2486855 RepID=A0ABY3WAE1_9MICC|nr:transporter substrate-binding domain-containing protein [Arthrobacter sulfonylureivorans]UNK47308.1 transporter substrate-binding domain-containing protein [Arthrobacter sulfonylureivorans]